MRRLLRAILARMLREPAAEARREPGHAVGLDELVRLYDGADAAGPDQRAPRRPEGL